MTGWDAASWLRLSAFGAAGFAAAAILVPLVASQARAHGLLAHPRDDRWHTRPVAKFGGVAMALALYAVLGPTGLASELKPLAVSVALMSGLGLIDDCRPIDARVKLVLQIAIAVLMVSGLSPAPLTGEATIDTMLSIFWVVGITNAINLLDNMDGLAAGVAAVAAAFFVAIAAGLPSAGGVPALTAAGAALAGVAAGFLCYNFQPAKIFMGDAGSYLLGSLLAGLTLAAGRGFGGGAAADPLVPCMLLLLPITDTTLVSLTRVRAGRSAFSGGRDHVSHKLVSLGLSERHTAVALYALSAAAGLVALLISSLGLRLVWPLAASLVLAFAVLALRLARVAATPSLDAAPAGLGAQPLAVQPGDSAPFLR